MRHGCFEQEGFQTSVHGEGEIRSSYAAGLKLRQGERKFLCC
jgi:hypothetical protein